MGEVSFTPWPLYLKKEPCCSFDRRLAGRCAFSGNKTKVFKFVGRRYTNSALQAPIKYIDAVY
jgi:hypothetical protein